MTARADFENLLGKASWGYDEADPDLIASCFADDARMSLQIGRDGAPVGPFEGRDAIRKLHADSMAAQTDQRRHNISNLWVDKETADEATVVSNLTLLSVEGGTARVLSSGWYRDRLTHRDGTRDELTRTGDGWRIARRHVYLDLPY